MKISKSFIITFFVAIITGIIISFYIQDIYPIFGRLIFVTVCAFVTNEYLYRKLLGNPVGKPKREVFFVLLGAIVISVILSDAIAEALSLAITAKALGIISILIVFFYMEATIYTRKK